jgi:HemY protein
VRARHDPAWTADGMVSERWMPVSPVTGRLDAFQWKDPIAGLETDEVIEHDRELRAAMAAPPVSPRAAEARPSEAMPTATTSMLPATTPGRTLARTTSVAAPIVPLVHVPDDPGPDARPLVEPETETSPEPNTDGWRGLFK